MEEIALCPRCARREVEPGSRYGFCADCIIEDIREKYSEKQRTASIGRREAWSERAQDSFVRDRQRKHRLAAAVKPKQPASSLDPWEVATKGSGSLPS